MQTLPTWVEVDLDALRQNIALIRGELDEDTQILLTVKADAYGHGAVQVARAARGSVQMFGVATVDEALELAAADTGRKILVLSPVLAEEIPAVVDNGFVTTVPSLEFAKALSDCAVKKRREAAVHIEVDTGMGRTGFLPDEMESLVRGILALKGVGIAGLFSHFPVSDSDEEFTRAQVSEFRAVAERLVRAGFPAELLHSANSAAIPSVPESHLGMVRPGLLAYGHYPGGGAGRLPVTPVMKWKARIVQVRDVPAGTTISYAREFETRRPTTIGVLPVGYGHGYPFRLSNRGRVIVGGETAPIVGRVTMDMTMIDLTDVKPRPKVGDEVLLVGRGDGPEITVDEVAGWAGTISYEVLTGISKRVPRAYMSGGEVQTIKSLLGVAPHDVGV